MKMPVSWYEQNLKNLVSSLEREKTILQQQQDKVHRCTIDVAKLEAQIKRAKDEGKESFDSDKYNVPMVYRNTSRNSLSNE